ncbi:hypothetical protein ACFY3U_02355 [Micromonospora sp. NPDC000089]|uniref:hypothetical protein n=1 Tax=unclassified Micromonospora TaxID=2617518 RepID=UPI0036BB856B
MQITEVSVLGLRSAVITLARPDSPLRFVLFPMVHFGLPSFYRQVADRLAACDLIVAEGYDGAAHLPAVVQALRGRYGYRALRGGEWLTVVDL